jgi:heat shock protein HtpX
MSDVAASPPAAENAGPRIHSTDFLAAQAENRRNTWLLIVALIMLGCILGYLIGWALEAWSTDAGYEALVAVSPLGILGATALAGIGVISSGVTLFAGDRVVANMAGARDVTADEEPVLHNVVEEMAIAAGLPVPRVMIIESDALNAFATGMRTDKAAIGVTRGLLKALPRDQLQGVIAHEMGHILNLDTRYMAAVGIMVGLIALVSDMALRSLRFSGRSSSRSSSKKGGGAAIIILVILVLFAILAPIAAQMVRFAVSRQREFLADATSVQLTRNPLGLMGALRALEGHAQGPEIGNRAIQHVFIVNPVKEFASKSNALLATHPSIDERIERLQNLGKV